MFLRTHAATCICESRPGANFYGLEKMPVGQYSGQAGTDQFHGLVQFSGAPLKTPERIARARLRLLLIRACSRASILTAQANAEAFDPRIVTWRNRPPVKPEAQTEFLTDGARAGEYLDYDVTSLLPKDVCGFFGLTLSGRPGQDNAAVFSTAEFAPPVLSLSFRDSRPGVDFSGIYRQHTFYLAGYEEAYSPPVALEDAERVTVFAKNSGCESLLFNLQISADGEDFLDDPQSAAIAPGKSMPLTPYLFARYLRARLANPGGGAVHANLIIQIQTRIYHAQ